MTINCVDMDKKQATLLSFFKGAKDTRALETKIEAPAADSGSTSAQSSPHHEAKSSSIGKSDHSIKGSGKEQRADAMERLASKRKKSNPNHKSDSSDGSGSRSSSVSDDSESSSSEEDRRDRSVKKPRGEIPGPSETVDVEGLFSFGCVSVDTPMVDRGFQMVEKREKSGSEPALSSEEIHQMCRSVPAYVGQFIRLYYELSSRFDFPSWMNPKNLRDKNKRAPSDPDYDVSSVFVPRKNGKVVEEGHCTPMLQQYWTIKEDHFNEIILFKVGKFYELFYIDAGIAQQVCQLKWMGHDRRAHVGFPETSLQNHAALLIKEGYTVCVVEQTETVSEANQRSAKSSGALVERKICEVFTTGTLIHEDMLSQGTHFLCSLNTAREGPTGMVLVDSATGKFHVGELADVSAVKTVLYSYQPREIIYDPKNISADLFKSLHAFKESQNCVLTRWTNSQPFSKFTVPVSAEGPALTPALHAAVNYLDHLLLFDQVVLCSEFVPLAAAQGGANRMIMDSTVLAHLEILKDSEGNEKGSLFKFLNRSVTPFGSRLLQRWVCAPLADVGAINQRLDAVSFLLGKPGVRKRLEEKLSAFPDLERKLQRISAMALQQQRNAIYFGEVENKRIGAFLAFLESIDSACALVEWLSAETSDSDALLLKQLTDVSACVRIKHTVQTLRCMVDVKKEGFAPHPGAFKEYDDVVGALKILEGEFDAELNRVKTELNLKEAVFVSVKFVNEIEIPVEFESKLKRHDSLLSGSGEITSCRKGFVRFQTDEIKRLAERHDSLEQEKKDLLYPFMARLFSAANLEKPLLNSLIERIATLDCLLSLSKVSGGKNWTRPVFAAQNQGRMKISLKQSRHPIQEYLMQLEREFVPNDVS